MEEMTSAMDSRPCLLLVYSDSVFAAKCSRHFRRKGWDVHLAASGAEAPRLLTRHPATVVAIDGDLTDEPGWQACARLQATHPGVPIVVLADDATSADTLTRARESAQIVRRDAIDELAQRLSGSFSLL